MAGDPAGRPRQPRTNYRKGLETRAQILRAAEEQIFELGFNRASSREVVRRSGLTWGVIQHHFGSYEAVLLAVVEQALDRLRVTLSDAQVPDGSTEAKVAHVADLVWDYYRQPRYLTYLEIYLNLLRDPETTEPTRHALVKVNAEIEILWHDLAVRLFGSNKRFLAVQRLLFGTMRGLALSRWLNEGRLDFEAERDVFVRAIAAYIDDSGGLGSPHSVTRGSASPPKIPATARRREPRANGADIQDDAIEPR